MPTLDDLQKQIDELKKGRIMQRDITPGAVKQRHCEAALMFTGLDANLPSGITGETVFYATDTKKLYIYNTVTNVWNYVQFT